MRDESIRGLIFINSKINLAKLFFPLGQFKLINTRFYIFKGSLPITNNFFQFSFLAKIYQFNINLFQGQVFLFVSDIYLENKDIIFNTLK